MADGNSNIGFARLCFVRHKGGIYAICCLVPIRDTHKSPTNCLPGCGHDPRSAPNLERHGSSKMQTFGWLEMPLFLIRISSYIPSKSSGVIFLSYLLIYPGRLPLQAAASSFEIGLKMTDGFYIIKGRNVRSGEGAREMLFDRAAKGKKSKELKGELKDLKKSLLNAGGEKAPRAVEGGD